ncbi:MAG: ABC transporter ATP-binding protein [Candidatus Eiseniibacteriota bacterium]
MPPVRLEHVGKSYGRAQRAVCDFDLAIQDGEFMVLVGPSGCGKSTVLRMIAGLEDVSEGEIWIGDQKVNDLSPRDRDIAMVFQNYALYPHLSVYENMAFALKRRKQPAAEVRRRVGETAETLGLTAALDRLPRELSGGERQRVALGRAMVRQPRVFLFDEPLSNLDAKLRVQMRAEIKRLHHSVRATMIYVTHDQIEAMTLGDRIAVMDRGVLQQVADPYTLYRSPNRLFVAGFIGAPPMNLFAARTAGERAPLEAEGVSFPSALRLPGAAQAGARELRVGIRPEHLRLEGDGAAADGRIAALAEVVEPVGGEVFVYWKTGVGTLISRESDAHGLKAGDRRALRFGADALHFFDPESGLALPLS